MESKNGSGADEVVTRTVAVGASVSASLPPLLLLLSYLSDGMLPRARPCNGLLLTEIGADGMHRCKIVKDTI